jgi:hypothetical protein
LTIPRALSRRLVLFVIPVVIATLVGMLLLWPHGRGPDLSLFSGQQSLVKGTVTGSLTSTCEGSPEGAAMDCQELRIHLADGPDAGTATSPSHCSSSSSASPHSSWGGGVACARWPRLR